MTRGAPDGDTTRARTPKLMLGDSGRVDRDLTALPMVVRGTRQTDSVPLRAGTGIGFTQRLAVR